LTPPQPDRNVLIVTDSSFMDIMFGDNAFLGTYVEAAHDGQPATWGPFVDGYIDGTSLWPSTGRDVRLWQATVGNLFALETPGVRGLLRRQFELTETEFNSLKFDAVLVYAGADYIRSQLFDTNRQDVTPSFLARELNSPIMTLTRGVPGKPAGAWLGVGFYSGNARPDPSVFQTHQPLRTNLDMNNAADRRYYDSVLCFLTTQLAQSHGVHGAITVQLHSAFTTSVPFVWIGNLAIRSNSNGYGRPFAVDVVNAARLMIGGISLALAKLCVIPSAPPRIGNIPIGVAAPNEAGPSAPAVAASRTIYGYVNFSGSTEDLGAVPHWGPNFNIVAGRRAVLTPFYETRRIATHLADIHTAVVVSLTVFILPFGDF
jgi:hypothetical protein